MNEFSQQIERLRELVERVKKTIKDSGEVRGFDKGLKARCDETLKRLSQLEHLAREADLREEYVDTLRRIDEQDICLVAMLIISFNIESQERELETLKRKLSELDELEAIWTNESALVTIGRIAQKYGAQNAKHVASLALQQDKRLWSQINGTVVVISDDDEHEAWWLKKGEVSKRLEKKVQELASNPEYAYLFGRESNDEPDLEAVTQKAHSSKSDSHPTEEVGC